MKYTKTISFALAVIIIAYTGYSLSLTTSQRKAKRTQFDQILSLATTVDQLKPAQAIIDELKKTEASRDARAMETDLAKRKADLESHGALTGAKQEWQEEKGNLEVTLRTATQKSDRCERELATCLEKMAETQKRDVESTRTLEDLRSQLENEKKRSQDLLKTNMEYETYFEAFLQYFRLDDLIIGDKKVLASAINERFKEIIAFYLDLQFKTQKFLDDYTKLPENCRTIEQKLVNALTGSLENFPGYFKQST